MKAAKGWALWIAILAAGAGLAYYGWRQYAEVVDPAVLQPAATAVPPEAMAEGEIRLPHYPIEGVRPQLGAALPEEKVGEEGELLPALAVSDGVVGEAISGLVAKATLRDLFVVQTFIRRIVATVDNLPREKVARRLVPVKSAEGRFLVVRQGDDMVISEENQARYTPYVLLAESIDSARLTAAYARLYPLFQEAYRELGYPNGHFNDRLVQVIDHLLATPRVEGPVRVVQPKVMYQFADPQLAGLSAGQQTMIRMGSENADRVKAKLREIRAYVTGGRSQPQARAG